MTHAAHRGGPLQPGECGVREQLADCEGVAGVRVDDHHLHAGPELGAALGEPAAHGGVATGTEDWFDSGWYFHGRRDYNTSW